MTAGVGPTRVGLGRSYSPGRHPEGQGNRKSPHAGIVTELLSMSYSTIIQIAATTAPSTRWAELEAWVQSKIDRIAVGR